MSGGGRGLDTLHVEVSDTAQRVGIGIPMTSSHAVPGVYIIYQTSDTHEACLVYIHSHPIPIPRFYDGVVPISGTAPTQSSRASF